MNCFAFRELRRCFAAALLLTLGFLSRPARADVVLFVEEPINLLAHISATGHTALLLTTLCSDDHLHLRPCRAGESGTVISRYQGLTSGKDWLAMPPDAYLYATSSLTEVPSSVTPEEADFLRASYRDSHPFAQGPQPDNDDWIQLVGQSYRRRIFCLRVRTTPEQDARLEAWMNQNSNKSRFNFLFSNCADFVRRMLNVLFPGSVHRNFIFDAGMTTPKQLASSLHHYSRRHPELGLSVEVIPQVPGTIRRSGKIKGVTESFVETTPYLTPLVYLNPLPFSGVIVSGLLDHRYNPQELPGTVAEYPLATLFPEESVSRTGPDEQPAQSGTASTGVRPVNLETQR